MAVTQWGWPMLKRWLFAPHIEFQQWECAQGRREPEYQSWIHARFENRRGGWRRWWPVTEARSCTAEVEIEPRPPFSIGRLYVTRDRPQSQWSMPRNGMDCIALVLDNDKVRQLGFDADQGRRQKTARGTYITDWHFVMGAGGRERLRPGRFRARIKLSYDGNRIAYSPYREIEVAVMGLLSRALDAKAAAVRAFGMGYVPAHDA